MSQKIYCATLSILLNQAIWAYNGIPLIVCMSCLSDGDNHIKIILYTKIFHKNIFMEVSLLFSALRRKFS